MIKRKLTKAVGVTSCLVLTVFFNPAFAAEVVKPNNQKESKKERLENCRDNDSCGVIQPSKENKHPGFRRLLEKNSPLNGHNHPHYREQMIRQNSRKQSETSNVLNETTALSVQRLEAQPPSISTQQSKRTSKESPKEVRYKTRILARGAKIHGTNGVRFDENNTLNIASALGREIVRMNPRSGKIINRLGPDQGVDLPDDLAFGFDGSMYWTSPVIGLVSRLTPEGTLTNQPLAPFANSITFSDDGRLFVSECLGGSQLFEVDPQLEIPPSLITDELGIACGLNGMDWRDGYLYGPRWFQGDVVRINVDSGEVIQIASDFGTPAAVKFDSRGRLHVLDTLNGEVVRLNKRGLKKVIAKTKQGLDNLAFDSRDRMYISSLSDGYIAKVKRNGKIRTISRGGMIVPGGVAVLNHPENRESVYVADFFSLREFSGRSGRQKEIDYHTIGATPVTSPGTVAADGDHLVLSSWFANTVQVWDPDEKRVLENYPDFSIPLNAMRFNDDLIVAELGTGSVVRATADDPSVRETLIAGLGVPAGLAATEESLFVSDWFSGMIWQVIKSGNLLTDPIPVAGPFVQPEGLAMDKNGHLLVVESGTGSVLNVNLNSGDVTTIATDLALGAAGPEGVSPAWMFNGVAVGQSGKIYVTGDIEGLLYRIDQK